MTPSLPRICAKTSAPGSKKMPRWRRCGSLGIRPTITFDIPPRRATNSTPDYGAGSSRDWAAKGTKLLGVRAIVAEGFERIHRSNLIGMGVIPLVFEEGGSWQSLGLKGNETVTIRGLHGDLKPHQRMIAEIVGGDGTLKRVPLICRIDTLDEL